MPDMKTLTINGVQYNIVDPNARPADWMPTSEEVGAAPMDYAKKVGNPYNLLDNSDFRNPVNQRGATQLALNSSYYQYFIDRWCFVDWSGNNKGVVSLTADGIACTNGTINWYQRFEKGHFKTNAKYTFVIYYADNTIEVRPQGVYPNWGINYTDSNEFDLFWFFVTNGLVVSKVALYEGEYIADTLPEYQPKGYGAELAECLRYFERLGGSHSEVLGNTVYVVGGFSSFVTTINYYPKRIPFPTVQLYDPSNYRLLCKTADTAQVFGASSVKSFGDVTVQSPFATITINIPNLESNNCWVMLQRADNAPNPYIDISADL